MGEIDFQKDSMVVGEVGKKDLDVEKEEINVEEVYRELNSKVEEVLNTELSQYLGELSGIAVKEMLKRLQLIINPNVEQIVNKIREIVSQEISEDNKNKEGGEFDINVLKEIIKKANKEVETVSIRFLESILGDVSDGEKKEIATKIYLKTTISAKKNAVNTIIGEKITDWVDKL